MVHSARRSTDLDDRAVARFDERVGDAAISSGKDESGDTMLNEL